MGKQEAQAKDTRFEQALALVCEKEDDSALVVGTQWTRRQALVLVRTVAPGLSPEEFQLFGMRCAATKLDPFQGQIHAVARGQGDDRKLAIQTGIDGYWLIAHRTGELAGMDPVIYTYKEDDASDPKGHPDTATATVYRQLQGRREPFTATVWWKEYYPGESKHGFMWRKMPHGQLGKCAKAAALRMAFPSDLAGLYIHEEMEQADDDPSEQRPRTQPKVSAETATLRHRLNELAAKKQVDPDVLPAQTGQPDTQPIRDEIALLMGDLGDAGEKVMAEFGIANGDELPTTIEELTPILAGLKAEAEAIAAGL